MSGEPGWYPDPAGAPDRYRYFDGSSWSAQTTDDPQAGAPETGPPASPAGRSHPTRWLVAITVAAVVIALASIAVRWPDRAEDPPVLFPTPPLSAPAVETNRPPSTDGPGSADPGSPSPRAIGCPDGAPDARAPHPVDDRVRGGSLSFPRVASFRQEGPEPRLGFAYDVVQQVRTVSLDPPWIAQLAVGRLLADGYPRDAQHTAEFVTECIVASDVYRSHRPQRRDLESRPITVSGVDGWLITAEIAVGVDGLRFAGDHVAVVVVPDGADWSVFFGAVPAGDAALTDTLTRTVLALRVG